MQSFPHTCKYCRAHTCSVTYHRGSFHDPCPVVHCSHPAGRAANIIQYNTVQYALFGSMENFFLHRLQESQSETKNVKLQFCIASVLPALHRVYSLERCCQRNDKKLCGDLAVDRIHFTVELILCFLRRVQEWERTL